jgi:hypothetical protein
MLRSISTRKIEWIARGVRLRLQIQACERYVKSVLESVVVDQIEDSAVRRNWQDGED